MKHRNAIASFAAVLMLTACASAPPQSRQLADNFREMRPASGLAREMSMEEADLVAVVRDEDINQAKTPADVLKHLASIRPFIELPDMVTAKGQPLNGPVITAINVGARLGVLGKPIAATPEMADALGKMLVVMRDQDGKELAKAPGAAILGHPLNAVVWLAQDIAQSGGKLRAGDILSLGSFTPPMPPKPGSTITVTYQGLPGDPSVSVRFK